MIELNQDANTPEEDKPNPSTQFYINPISGAEEPLGHVSNGLTGYTPETILRAKQYPVKGESTLTPPSNPVFDQINQEVKDEDHWLITDAARIHNSTWNLTGYVDRNLGYGAKVEDGYLAFRDEPDLFNGLSQERADKLNQSHSRYESRRILRDFATEDSAREHLSESSWGGVASFAAIALDPFTYVGGAAGSVLRMATTTAGGAALQEGILYANQDERTLSEVALNVTSAAALAGGLGLMLNKFGRGSQNIKQLNEAVSDGSLEQQYMEMQMQKQHYYPPKGVGSNVVDDLNDYEIASNVISPKFIKKIQMPGFQRTITNSPFLSANKLLFDSVDTPLSRIGHLKGQIDDSAESLIRQYEANTLYPAMRVIDEVTIEAQKLGISKEMFWDEVRLFASMDEMNLIGPVSDLIRTGGTALRQFFEIIGGHANERGLLADIQNVRGAVYHVQRAYNVPKIERDPLMFKDYIERKVIEANRSLAPDDLAAKIADHGFDNLEDMAKDAAESVYHKVMFGESKPRSVNQRSVDLSDLDLSPYLISDPHYLMRAYSNYFIPKIVMHDKFGVSSFEEFIRPIEQEHARLVDAAGTNTKLRRSLNKELQQTTKALEVMYNDVMRRPPTKNFKAISNVAEEIRNVNVAAQMHNVTISSLTDSANLTVLDGIGPAVEVQLKALTSGLTKMFTGKLDDNALLRNELGALFNASEYMANLRTSQIVDLVDEFNPENTILNFTRHYATTALHFAGINKWTTQGKNSAAQLFMGKVTKLGEALESGKGLSKADRLNMAHWGLNEQLIVDIHKEIKANVTKSTLNMNRWNPDTLLAFQNSGERMAMDIIITPGHADIPHLMKNDFFKTILQFKSFGFASYNKMIAGGLSRLEANKALAIAMTMAISATVIQLESKLFGKALPESWDMDDPNSWWYAMLQRSGLGSLPFDLWNQIGAPLGVPTVGHMAHNAIDPNNPKKERYVPDWARMLGPTARTLDSMSQITMAPFRSKGWDEKSTDAALKFVPLINVGGMYTLTDALMGGMESLTGLPYKEKDTFIRN